MARHLTIEDRDRIAELKHQASRQNAIARALQRIPSTICREPKAAVQMGSIWQDRLSSEQIAIAVNGHYCVEIGV